MPADEVGREVSTPVSTFRAVTAAFGTTAPVESVTVPVNAPSPPVCAWRWQIEKVNIVRVNSQGQKLVCKRRSRPVPLSLLNAYGFSNGCCMILLSSAKVCCFAKTFEVTRPSSLRQPARVDGTRDNSIILGGVLSGHNRSPRQTTRALGHQTGYSFFLDIQTEPIAYFSWLNRP